MGKESTVRDLRDSGEEGLELCSNGEGGAPGLGKNKKGMEGEEKRGSEGEMACSRPRQSWWGSWLKRRGSGEAYL